MLYEYISIPFTQKRPGLFVGSLEPLGATQNMRFYLAVKAETGQFEPFERISQRLVKIAALEVMDMVIGSGLPGVSFSSVVSPPAAFPVRPGFHYLQIDTDGPYWKGIEKFKTIAVRMPPSEFTDVALEMLTTRPLPS